MRLFGYISASLFLSFLTHFSCFFGDIARICLLRTFLLLLCCVLVYLVFKNVYSLWIWLDIFFPQTRAPAYLSSGHPSLRLSQTRPATSQVSIAPRTTQCPLAPSGQLLWPLPPSHLRASAFIHPLMRAETFSLPSSLTPLPMSYRLMLYQFRDEGWRFCLPLYVYQWSLLQWAAVWLWSFPFLLSLNSSTYFHLLHINVKYGKFNSVLGESKCVTWKCRNINSTYSITIS